MHSVTASFQQTCGVFKALWLRLVFTLFSLVLPASVFGSFGLTTSTDFYTVDTDAGLVFKVRRVDYGSSTQSPGDLASLVYNGVEYQNQIRGSHVNSGFDWLYSNTSASAVSAETVGPDIVKVTVNAGNLTHYYIARRGDSNIYMGTYFTSEPDVHGLVRYIMRIPNELLPNGPAPSDIRNNTGAIESSDIFGLANGETRSKHYSNMRQMDWHYIGATGPSVGVWMVKGNEEGMSGGPFYRCLIAQTGGDQEVYAMLNYGEAQPDIFRPGTLNLYTYVFNNGSAPVSPNLSWMDSLNLLGWVSASARGAVSGTASGVPAEFQAVVGFSNGTAQYWATVSNGTFTCSGMIPGSYKATLFKGELEVAVQENVVVTAGGTTPLSIASTETVPSVIFRIGEWDGTPAGFMNADKITVMHPTDVRMTPWGPITYTVGVDSPIAFPAAQFRLKNSPTTIKFKLAPNQVADLTFRIGITCNYAGGRPVIAVNSTWNSPIPAAPTQPNTRTITVGTYRGNNNLFTYTIPASALVAGTNTLTISPVSGTSDIGPFLSASYVFDAVELVGPIATPAITYVGGNPLVISGTAEPGRTVTLTLDGTGSAGTALTSVNGAWSTVYAGALADGLHNFTAVASDNFGHSSPASTAYSFQVGIAMPTIVSAIGDTGTYASGATTSDRVFLFTGTAAPGATVAITRAGVGIIGSTSADGSGNWTFDYTTVTLPDGLNVFFATVSAGGQVSPSSPQFTLNLAGAPRVAIERLSPPQQIIPSSIGSVDFRVTFNHTVSGVTPGAFSLTTTDSAVGTVASVSASSGTTFNVTVNVSGVGSLRLNLTANSGVVDEQSNPESAYNAGQSYTLVVASTGNGAWIQPDSGGLWSDPSNWNNAVVAAGSANTADFSTLDLTANNTVHLDSPRTINRVVFGDVATSTPANWTLDNNGSIASVLTLAGTTPTITVNGVTGGTGTSYGLNGTIARVDAGLAGTGGLIKNGAGTLVLGGANSLTGALNVNVGYVQVPVGGALSLGSGAVNVTTNTRIHVNGGSVATTGLVTVNSGSIVVDNGLLSMGSYRTAGSFGATLRVNGGTVNTGGIDVTRNAGTSPDYTTGVVVTGGTLSTTTIGLGTLNSYGNLSVEGGLVNATGPITIGNQQTGGRGGAMRVIGGTLISTNASLGVLMCRNNGTNTNNVAQAIFTGGVSSIEKFTLGYDANVTAGSATITINGGTLFLGAGGIVKNGAATMATNLNFSSGTLGAKANWATALPINLPTNGNITFRTADASDEPFDIALNGVVGGAGGFTKTGAGTLTLTAASTYTGPTLINGGTLRLVGSLGAAANALAVNSGGVLAGSGTINRAVTLNSGAILAPDGATNIAALTAASLTWNDGGVFAVDLGADGACDGLALTGALSKGTAGTYTLALNPTAALVHGSIYDVATFGSSTFVPGDFTVTGLPDGFAGVPVVTATQLRVVIVARPVVTSSLAAGGLFNTAFSFTVTASNDPTAFGASGLPPGLAIDASTGVISGAPSALGTYPVLISATNAAGTGYATLTITINPAPVTITLGVAGGSGPIKFAYDGTPKAPSFTTEPSGIAMTVTYNGSTTVPTLPGTYHVVVTSNDPNYTGSTEGTLVITITALVRHAPILNGDLDGSLQLLSGESFAVNGSGYVAGDLLVPGKPTVKLNGLPTYAGTLDETGDENPKDYTLTLNDGAVIRYVVRRVDPIPLTVVTAPQIPAGTRDVTVNSVGQNLGDLATLRNLTLNNGAGAVVVPPGVYGSFTANSGTCFIFGVAGAEEPVVYELQQLSIKGGAKLKIVGPVIVKLAIGTTVSGAIGSSDNPEWLELKINSGGLTINSAASLFGLVDAPNGTVTINGGGVLHGRVEASGLKLATGGVLEDSAP